MWRRILKIFERNGARFIPTWGMVAWASFSREVENYDSTGVEHKVKICNGSSTIVHSRLDWWENPNERFLPLWELLCSMTLWAIWKARNIEIFESKRTPPVVSIQEIWSELIHTLKGQFDDIIGQSEIEERRRSVFHR